jgi:hypothetical protein
MMASTALTALRCNQRRQGAIVKNIIGFPMVGSLLLITFLMVGCVAGSTISHEDSPGATKRDSGPALCRDGSTPPCNDRD